MRYTKLDIYRKRLKRLRRELKAKGGHRLCAEITALIGEIPSFRVHSAGSLPLITHALAETEELTTGTVYEALLPYADVLDNADFMTLMWQVRFAALLKAADDGERRDIIYTAADVDAEQITEKLDPLCIRYSGDTEYELSDERTKAMMRADTTRCAQAAGIDERRLAAEYIITARHSGAGLCDVIRADVRRLFPYANTYYYTAVQLAFSLGISALTVVFAGWFAGIAVFAPAAAVAKTLIDALLLRSSKPCDIPSAKLSEAANYEVVCVLSALVSSEEDIRDGLARLHRARLKNTSPNIRFCLLCDLPAADERETSADDSLISAAASAFEQSDGSASVIIRHREFSRTQQKFQGRERKRGAIEDLVRFICGENVQFRAVFGDISGYAGIPFICTLDYDTLPLMDSINSLVAAAVHPCNSEYGIFAPRITTSLTSSLRTGLTRLFGTGGCSGASVYDSLSSELYFDCFGEGTFTGKGLIRTEKYYRHCVGALPEERVLSHDIIEGGILDTAYCGDIEFSDGMPPTTRGFFKRSHRWMRGDFLNLPLVFRKDLSLLTKYKLTDNVRRALTPLNALLTLFFTVGAGGAGTYLPGIVAVLSLTLPFILGLIPAAIRGLGFSNTREFYAPITSLSRQLVTRIFAEIVFMCRSAIDGLDAAVRSAWRLMTGRKLLEWQTASAFDKTDGYGWVGMVPASLLGTLLFGVSVYCGSVFDAVIGILASCCLPAAVICDRAYSTSRKPVKEHDRKLLTDEARREWAFYTDHVTEAENWLPPDNVQYSPVFRISHRTSPTNIGMYLLACVCANELGFIDNARLVTLIDRTVSTVEKLAKYKGSLYNWYETDTLKVMDPFVSSVDSGNFLCSLVAVRRKLMEDIPDAGLIRRIGRLISDADVGVFYNRARKLFSVGINSDTGKKAPNCYDMLMSEARMLSFFAVARGYADRSHWRALSRVMSRSGYYAGPIAWSGTMFEYFMPEILLESKRGSLCYEALGYAVHCQKQRGREMHMPFGVSESGYYAFDRDLNYQYKAHGVQKLALCGGMDREYVISPYSTFLALSYSFSACMKNIARLADRAFSHRRYGFYEAVDLTGARTGAAAAVVRSHMAHHVGMSICGITNTLCGGRLRKLFMSDETMQRADELLEERVMAGEVVVDIEKLRDRTASDDRSERFDEFNILRPRFNVVANRRIAVFASDTGLCTDRYCGRAVTYPTRDFLRRPDGLFMGVREGDADIPFYMSAFDGGTPMKRRVVFSENTAEYFTECAGLSCGMKLSVFGEKAAAVRDIVIENSLSYDRSAEVYIYMRPALAPEADIIAHPAFADLFLRPEYDRENRLFLARRRDRATGKETWLAAGFRLTDDLIYSFSREKVLSYGEPLCFTKGFELTSSDNASVPSPCIFIRMKAEIPANSGWRNSFFVCCGETRDEVTALALEVRNTEPSAELMPYGAAVSPLPGSTLAGRLARGMLPAMLCRNVFSEEILTSVFPLGRDTLWRLGISGDRPIVLYRFAGDEPRAEAAALMAEGLFECGTPIDVVMLCDDISDKSRALFLQTSGTKCIYPVMTSELTGDELAFIRRSAVFIFDKCEERRPPVKLMELVPAEPYDTGLSEGFRDNGYIVKQKGHPFCNIIASEEFGCIVSQNSLGFTYALNSRENKLTPWYNDIMRDNNGEMLLVKGLGRYCDIIGGSTAVFSPSKAEYLSRIGKLIFRTEVGVMQSGMAKIITVSVENTGELDKQCALSYYTEPVLAWDRSANNCGAELTYRRIDGGIAVRNTVSPEFTGEMAVACITPDCSECAVITNREQFWAGEVNGEVRAFANSCAAVTAKVRIPPRSTVKLRFVMCYSRTDAAEMLKAAVSATPADCEVRYELHPTIKSGNDTLDRLYNVWLPWQVLGCRMRARTGFYQNGGAYGFRDQLQDSTAAAYFMPAEAKRMILRCCGSQFVAGDVLHWWHETGTGKRGIRTKCSDDMLWLPYAAAEYVRVTGDVSILDEPVPYINGDELGTSGELYMQVTQSGVSASLYEHCKKAFERCYRVGPHSLIKIGSGDWNDGYNRVGEDGLGESVWLSMFYVWTAKLFVPYARARGDDSFAAELEKRAAGLSAACEDEAFENGYYLRAFYDDGRKMGAEGSECCEIDLLPQAFAELAGLPDREKRRSALKAAFEKLFDPKTNMVSLFSPPFNENSADDPGYVRGYPEGIRENGGQYTHAAVWLALAFLRSGDRKTALLLANALSPAERGRAYKNEPYFMSADVYTNPECKGRGGWSMYTGSAAWYYRLLGELYGGR
ncbi:MAG: hypothetical protein J6O50_12240 [Ruminiclostridium sp.]|nr:hypothetical protein [Ruminiclostridium sp.]